MSNQNHNQTKISGKKFVQSHLILAYRNRRKIQTHIVLYALYDTTIFLSFNRNQRASHRFSQFYTYPYSSYLGVARGSTRHAISLTCTFLGPPACDATRFGKGGGLSWRVRRSLIPSERRTGLLNFTFARIRHTWASHAREGNSLFILRPQPKKKAPELKCRG